MKNNYFILNNRRKFMIKVSSTFVCLVLSLLVLLGNHHLAFAEQNQHGSCSMTIYSDKNDWNHKAQASGECNGLVEGYYNVDHQFWIIGMDTEQVKYSGQKFVISTPASETYIDCTLTVTTVKVSPPPPPPPTSTTTTGGTSDNNTGSTNSNDDSNKQSTGSTSKTTDKKTTNNKTSTTKGSATSKKSSTTSKTNSNIATTKTETETKNTSDTSKETSIKSEDKETISEQSKEYQKIKEQQLKNIIDSQKINLNPANPNKSKIIKTNTSEKIASYESDKNTPSKRMIGIILVLCVLVGGGVYYWFKLRKSKNSI